jgi:ABC-type nitrate/sulfonate/bicarbonate transport system substrate-binding protein
MRRSTIAILVVIAVSIVVLVLFSTGERWRGSSIEEAAVPQKVKIGFQESPAMALVLIAKSERLLPSNLELVPFQAGKLALQGMVSGELDLAIAGDVPVGLALYQGLDIKVIGEVVSKSEAEVRMVVRTNEEDCSSLQPLQYFKERRKIATSFGGGPEYFTYTFLQHHRVATESYELISQTPLEMPGALQARAVDGISVFDPAAAYAEQILATNGCTFPDPGVYRQHYVLAALPDTLAKKRPAIEAFIQSLKKAEDYARDNPQQVAGVVSKATSIPVDVAQRIVGKFEYGVVLDAGLVELWEQQAAWTASKGIPKHAKPDAFRSAIDRSFLNDK